MGPCSIWPLFGIWYVIGMYWGQNQGPILGARRKNPCIEGTPNSMTLCSPHIVLVNPYIHKQLLKATIHQHIPLLRGSPFIKCQSLEQRA